MISPIDYYLLLIQVKFNDVYWSWFADDKGWLENLSFIANIVMACAAIAATWFGISTLSHTKKVANVQFTLEMIARIASMQHKIRNIGADENSNIHEELLNLLEAYGSFLVEKSVYGHARLSIISLLDDELPELAELEPIQIILAESASHPTRLINIRNYLKKLHKNGARTS